MYRLCKLISCTNQLGFDDSSYDFVMSFKLYILKVQQVFPTHWFVWPEEACVNSFYLKHHTNECKILNGYKAEGFLLTFTCIALLMSLID